MPNFPDPPVKGALPHFAYPPEAVWPPEVAEIPHREADDGARTITGKQLADLLGCSTDNLRQMIGDGKLTREAVKGNVSTYRLEEAARIYLEKYPGKMVMSGDVIAIHGRMATRADEVPPPYPVPTVASGLRMLKTGREMIRKEIREALIAEREGTRESMRDYSENTADAVIKSLTDQNQAVMRDLRAARTELAQARKEQAEAAAQAEAARQEEAGRASRLQAEISRLIGLLTSAQAENSRLAAALEQAVKSRETWWTKIWKKS
jgi:hypothetical protein